MPDARKLHAKLQKAEAEADRDRAALRSKAEKKIARIKNDLRAEEAKITTKLDRRREKTAAKLAGADRPGEGQNGTRQRAVPARSGTRTRKQG